LSGHRVLVGALLVVLLVLGGIAAITFPRLLGANSADAPHFVEEAQVAGLDHAYTGEFEYFVGGGVAAFDCNDDLLPDLYLAGGASPAGLFRNVSGVGGQLGFEQIADATTDLDAVTGAYPLDIDGDGVIDLAVLRHGENVLLRGLGGCHFERANELWSFDGGAAWSTAFSARWDPGRNFPTLAIGNYLKSTDPNILGCADNELVRPTSPGTGFASPEPLTPGWCTLSMLFSDWDRSGRRDLRVSNDHHYYSVASDGQEQLWQVPASGSPSAYTAADGWRRVRIWGMGIASYDVTGDGYPDYYLTSQGDNKLQALTDDAARPEFEDIALGRDATANPPYEGDTIMPSTAWHDEFADVNNDGLIDLFVAKGNVEAMPDFASRDPSNLLIGQANGMFVEGAPQAGTVDFARARGAAIVDLNADGLLDMVVVVRRENVRLWRNVGSGSAGAPAPLGNWLAARLTEDGGNRDAIGSWIEVRVGDQIQQKEVTVGGGHVSGELVPAHFGLGAASDAQIRVTWPDGEIGPWMAVAANGVYSVTRGASEATRIQ
jgi:hypothetical protein